MTYLLDTHVVSELTKPLPNRAVVLALREHEATCAICAITVEELTFGCARMQSAPQRALIQRWLDGLVARLPVLPFDTAAALWLGQERARLASLGRSASRTDGRIAAVAVTHGLSLVTMNGRDFAGFEGLRMVDELDRTHGERPKAGRRSGREAARRRRLVQWLMPPR
jgi:tRNA(fMet)-specific endonuclease VapC